MPQLFSRDLPGNLHPEFSGQETPKETEIGVLNLEYDSKKTITDPEGKVLFGPDDNFIDIHILHDKRKENPDSDFISKLQQSLKDLAQYISQNRQTQFQDIQAIRGITYDAMAKIAARAGFKMQEIDGTSLGFTMIRIAGEYIHSNRGKRGKKIEGYYAVTMPIDEFLKKWGTKNEDTSEYEHH